VTYSYDRRRAADEATAATPKPNDPLIPRNEHDEVIKHLVQVHYIMKEWGIRSSHGLMSDAERARSGVRYYSTPQFNMVMGDLEDELDSFTKKIRALPYGVPVRTPR
jgi:hypothetical protein